MGIMSRINAGVDQHKQSYLSQKKNNCENSKNEISAEKNISEQSSPAEPPRSPRDPHSAEFLAEKIPCPVCDCGVFWESIYFDGVVRCWQCETPPGLELVGRKIARQVTIDVRTSDESGLDRGELIEWEQVIFEGGKPAPRAAAWLASGQTTQTTSAAVRPTLAAPGDAGGDVAGDGGDVAEDLRDDTDRFVEIRGGDGRRLAVTGWALRGWDNPKSPNFNLRLVQATELGFEQADRVWDDAQGELRAEMLK